MVDGSASKPVTPPSSGDGASSSPPASSSPEQDIQTGQAPAAPVKPPASTSTTATQSSESRMSSSPSGGPVPRPESTLVQTAGQQDSSTIAAKQQQQGPVLPPRNYPRDPTWLNYGNLPTVPASRVLPRFFKILAIAIFITGTSATLLTYLYQRFVFPKLMLTRARLAALHQHQKSLYDKLLLSVHSLVYSSDSVYPQSQCKLAQLRAPDPTLPSTAQEDITKLEGLPQEKTASESEDEEPLFADESPLEKSKELQVAPPAAPESLTSQLESSLVRLRQTIQRHTKAQPAQVVDDDEEKEGLPDQTTTQKTMKSLEELSTYLTNEAFYASTPAFSAASYGWSYGAASTIPQRSGMDRDKIAQVKNEIRSLKGMLLTRRNFAIPKQETTV